MLTPLRVTIAAIVCGAVAIAVLGEQRALLVYAFFALIAGGLALGAGVGGGWLRDTSRDRFDERGRGRGDR